MAKQLKPCPFCGGKAVLIPNEDTPFTIGPWVECPHCHVGQQYVSMYEDDAIAAWNRRANDD